MLELRKLNVQDVEKEYEAIKKLPANENGLENIYYNYSKEDFISKAIPERIDCSNGIGLKEGYVPDTYYFLWNDDEIVGLFKIRHYLNDFLRNGSGHIGCSILPEYRGKGYGKEGLKLAIEVCKNLIPEDEIYMAVHKDNPASLQMQIANGAYIAGENEKEYLTRIKIK